MKLLGGFLIAAAGVWSGFLAAGKLSASAARCGSWCRMLELLSFELVRFLTPLPELFASLAERLDGAAGETCGSVAEDLRTGLGFRAAWRSATENVPREERELLLPLGDVLGRFGAEEQAACADAVRERMNGLWKSRRRELGRRSRVCVGVGSALGLMLAVLLM